MELSPETKFRLAFTSVLGAVAMLGFTPEVNNIENHSALSTPAPIIKWLNGARIEFYKDTITTDLCVGTTHVHELSVVNPDESGRNEVYVQSFPTAGQNVQISTEGGDQPKWRGDSKEIFYKRIF